MFTGLVQCIGKVVRSEPRGAGARLTIDAPRLVSEGEPLTFGESIAVDGACLTVAESAGSAFTADVLEETLRCTCLGGLVAGDGVNLERALKVGDRLGGHLVSGHVDEVGRLAERCQEGADARFRIACSADFARNVVRKGSVALSGVSLTVRDVGADWFDVALIPTTLAQTKLGALRPGDALNLEADPIALYVRRALGQDALTEARLLEAGFLD